MARCSSRPSNSDSYQSDDDEQILKLFALEDEVDASFSGFSAQTERETVVPVHDPETEDDRISAQLAMTQKINTKIAKTSGKGKLPVNRSNQAKDLHMYLMMTKHRLEVRL